MGREGIDCTQLDVMYDDGKGGNLPTINIMPTYCEVDDHCHHVHWKTCTVKTDRICLL